MEIKEKAKLCLPNVCSILNACSGVLAILISAYYKNPHIINISCFLIIIGGFFDSIDGKIARKYNASSEFGKQLDSFSDLITFGVAPICVFMSLQSITHDHNFTIFEILVGTFYILCAIYRLARFNVTPKKDYFEGLPTTVTGAIMSLYILNTNFVFRNTEISHLYTVFGFCLIFTLGICMILKFKIKKL